MILMFSVSFFLFGLIYMAPNKKAKKNPRARRPRATNENKATASNKTNIRVTVNPAPARRRRAANKGQSAAQVKGPQIVFMPQNTPQVIQPSPSWNDILQIRNPPPLMTPARIPVFDRADIVQPSDIVNSKPMFVGGGYTGTISPMTVDDRSTGELTTVKKSRDSTFNFSNDIGKLSNRVTPMPTPLRSGSIDETNLSMPGAFENVPITFDDVNVTPAISAPVEPPSTDPITEDDLKTTNAEPLIQPRDMPDTTGSQKQQEPVNQEKLKNRYMSNLKVKLQKQGSVKYTATVRDAFAKYRLEPIIKNGRVIGFNEGGGGDRDELNKDFIQEFYRPSRISIFGYDTD